jgi:hypothetical protein
MFYRAHTILIGLYYVMVFVLRLFVCPQVRGHLPFVRTADRDVRLEADMFSRLYCVRHCQNDPKGYCTVLTARMTTVNIKQFYVLPTQCIYVFCVDLRTNSDYFPIQH